MKAHCLRWRTLIPFDHYQAVFVEIPQNSRTSTRKLSATWWRIDTAFITKGTTDQSTTLDLGCQHIGASHVGGDMFFPGKWSFSKWFTAQICCEMTWYQTKCHSPICDPLYYIGYIQLSRSLAITCLRSGFFLVDWEFFLGYWMISPIKTDIPITLVAQTISNIMP